MANWLGPPSYLKIRYNYRMANPFEILKNVEFSENPPAVVPEKVSKKPMDVRVRNMLEANPELKEKIIRGMQKLEIASRSLPFVHITTDRIVSQDDSQRDAGMVEKIQKTGFKARHTNVGAFVVRRNETRLAQPTDYEKTPGDFLKSLTILLQRYWHHGSRTNKDIYKNQRDEGKGLPIMLLLEGTFGIERGTDYDDHYILTENVPAHAIIGKINLESESGITDDMIVGVANKILDITNE